MDVPWINKYKPRKVCDVVGNEDSLIKIKDFVINYTKKGKKALLVYGDNGNGKTSSIHAIAEELGFELFELNASDTRNADQINSLIGQALNNKSFFFQGKIILIDEIDGLAGNTDRGGVQALLKLIEKSNYPIIIIANDPWDQKLSSLRKKCVMINFKPLNATTIFAKLKKICDNEHIAYDNDALNKLSHISRGDMRAAINDLEIFASDGRINSRDIEELSFREKTDTIINAMLKVFKTKDVNIAISAFDNINEDLEKIFLWLDYNLPYEYTEINDLKNAYDNVAKADIFFGRIRKWQYYRFYVYCYNLLSVGVAISKKEKYKKFVQYKESSRILKIWMSNMKNTRRDSIAEKIAEKTHTSKKKVIKDTILYMKTIFKKDKKNSVRLADEFELNNEEIEWLRN
ncbi:MAG: replication factor C large subunit [Candidatus Woesearchaeota archaeon]